MRLVRAGFDDFRPEDPNIPECSSRCSTRVGWGEEQELEVVERRRTVARQNPDDRESKDYTGVRAVT
jgi:hypothetical protein